MKFVVSRSVCDDVAFINLFSTLRSGVIQTNIFLLYPSSYEASPVLPESCRCGVLNTVVEMLHCLFDCLPGYKQTQSDLVVTQCDTAHK